MMTKIGSSKHGKVSCKSDYHKEEDFHTNFRRKIVLYLSKPSEMMKNIYDENWTTHVLLPTI